MKRFIMKAFFVDGEPAGWKVYEKNGFLGSLTFTGYVWI